MRIFSVTGYLDEALAELVMDSNGGFCRKAPKPRTAPLVTLTYGPHRKRPRLTSALLERALN